MTEKELWQIAREAAENAYAPYSHFHVGAAVRHLPPDTFGILRCGFPGRLRYTGHAAKGNAGRTAAACVRIVNYYI